MICNTFDESLRRRNIIEVFKSQWYLRYLVTTCANAAVLWQSSTELRGQNPTQLSVLRGHKREVSQVDFNRGQGGDEEEEQRELITCSYDRVILWSVHQLLQTKASGAGGTTVAREMGDISACRLVKHKVSKNI